MGVIGTVRMFASAVLFFWRHRNVTLLDFINEEVPDSQVRIRG